MKHNIEEQYIIALYNIDSSSLFFVFFTFYILTGENLQEMLQLFRQPQNWCAFSREIKSNDN